MKNKIITVSLYMILSIVLAHYVLDLSPFFIDLSFVRVQGFNPFWIKCLIEEDNLLMFQSPIYYVINKLNIALVIAGIIGVIKIKNKHSKIKYLGISTIVFVLNTLYTYYVYLQLGKYINSVDIENSGQYYFSEHKRFLYVLLNGGDTDISVSYIPYAILLFAAIWLWHSYLSKNNMAKEDEIVIEE